MDWKSRRMDGWVDGWMGGRQESRKSWRIVGNPKKVIGALVQRGLGSVLAISSDTTANWCIWQAVTSGHKSKPSRFDYPPQTPPGPPNPTPFLPIIHQPVNSLRHYCMRSSNGNPSNYSLKTTRQSRSLHIGSPLSDNPFLSPAHPAEQPPGQTPSPPPRRPPTMKLHSHLLNSFFRLRFISLHDFRWPLPWSLHFSGSLIPLRLSCCRCC